MCSSVTSPGVRTQEWLVPEGEEGTGSSGEKDSVCKDTEHTLVQRAKGVGSGGEKQQGEKNSPYVRY